MSAAGPVPVTGDATRLQQALRNLVGNAVQHTPAGTAVHVAITTSAGSVQIDVADNGPGIAPQDLPRIFERFYRVDRSRSRDMGGTGLGLSIVKHVAQVHGGQIDVDSTPGKGSTFRLRLPVG